MRERGSRPVSATGSQRGLLASRRSTLTLTLIMVLLLAGCGGGGKSEPANGNAAPASGATITIKNFQFQPASLIVTPGAKVTVTNKDSAPHTVTATGAKKFDTGNIGAGQIATFTAPTTPGSYPYICTIHDYMHGTLQVK